MGLLPAHIICRAIVAFAGHGTGYQDRAVSDLASLIIDCGPHDRAPLPLSYFIPPDVERLADRDAVGRLFHVRAGRRSHGEFSFRNQNELHPVLIGEFGGQRFGSLEWQIVGPGGASWVKLIGSLSTPDASGHCGRCRQEGQLWGDQKGQPAFLHDADYGAGVSTICLRRWIRHSTWLLIAAFNPSADADGTDRGFFIPKPRAS